MEPNPHVYDSPYSEHFRVKITRFPDGGGEAVCCQEMLYRPNEAELSQRARAATSGHEIWRGKVKRTEQEVEQRRETNLEHAVRRATKAVRMYVRRIGADHLLTVTYRENVTDYAKAKADWQEFTRSVRSRYPECCYVVVTEQQERGSLHFHAAVVGYQDVRWLRRCWWKIVGDGGGNIDVQGPPKRWGGVGAVWQCAKLSLYLTKYMAKSFDASLHHSHRYRASLNAPKLRVTAFYLQADDMNEAIRQTFSIVAGGLAVDVCQWLRPNQKTYWVSSLRPPSCPF